ncbi:urease accessory protein UreF [Aestuariibius sp. 2305UL40-4]|uniref:urease accessory protein UreF n=1 Tax=Aestuariibius violaceus TaxID=3234132 RepID=UPI00345E3BB9
MLAPEELLCVSQWLSPAFPVGGFAYSQGLEAGVSSGDVCPDTLEDWVDGVLRYGAGRMDAVLLCAAARGEDVSELAEALAVSSGRRRETLEMGAALGRCLRGSFDMEMPDGAYPVVFGQAVRARGLPLEPVVVLFLQSLTTLLVHAGQRLMPLGQEKAQRIIAELGPVCVSVAGEALASGIDEIGTATFGADLASLRQDSLEVRIFRS